MTIDFYPPDDLGIAPLNEKLDLLLDAAEKYKAAVLDAKTTAPDATKKSTPKDLPAAFNWEEIAKVLREVRSLPETSSDNKLLKAQQLTKLAEIYEVLRAAKMAKLDAVRIALVNEANQISSSAA